MRRWQWIVVAAVATAVVVAPIFGRVGRPPTPEPAPSPSPVCPEGVVLLSGVCTSEAVPAWSDPAIDDKDFARVETVACPGTSAWRDQHRLYKEWMAAVEKNIDAGRVWNHGRANRLRRQFIDAPGQVPLMTGFDWSELELNRLCVQLGISDLRHVDPV